MALDFENVRLLSYTHSPIFFDSGLRFKIQQNFVIEGTLLEQQNTDGVGPIMGDQTNLQNNAVDYQPITLNGFTFGVGKILNIEFSQGTDVQENRYTYTISAFTEGNLFNAVSNEFSGIDWSGDAIYAVERIDESFSYQNNDINDQQYEHRVDIRFNRDPAQLGVSPITLAQSLATNLMAATNLTGFLGSYNNINSSSSFKETHVETYNVMDFSCSFSTTAILPSLISETQQYSIDRTITLQLNEAGIVTASEKGIIKGLTSPLSASANIGFAAEAIDANVYTRVNDAYTYYLFSSLPLSEDSSQPEIVSPPSPLQPVIITRAVSINKFSGEIEYTFTFTNDPKYYDLAIWSYTTELTHSVENYIQISENGTIRGVGRPWLDKYNNAFNFYTTNVEPGIANRLDSLYTNFGGTNEFGKIKDTFTASQFVGEITYSQVFTDNDLYLFSGLMRKEEVEVITSFPVQIVYSAPIINYNEIIQPQNNTTLGKQTINIKLRGTRAAQMSDYLTYATDYITTNGYNVIGDDTYLSQCQYSLSPLKNQFSFVAEFTFHGADKEFGDLSLSPLGTDP